MNRENYYAVRSRKTGHFIRRHADGALTLSEGVGDYFCECSAPAIRKAAQRKFARGFDLIRLDNPQPGQPMHFASMH
jgi:hypothetical protein